MTTMSDDTSPDAITVLIEQRDTALRLAEQATAKAEALQAERDAAVVMKGAALREVMALGIAEGERRERAAIVAWLRAFHWTHNHKIAATFFAELIEHGLPFADGDHITEAKP